MPSYYTQFCLYAAEHLTDAERAWIAAQLAERDAWESDAAANTVGAPAPLTAEREQMWCDLSGVHIQIDAQGRLLLETYEDGAPEGAALFIQGFLAAHRPTVGVVLTWANSASRCLPGAFSGGICLVTGAEVYWFDPWAWQQATAQAAGVTLRAADV